MAELFLIWFIGGVVLMLLEFVLPGGIVFFLGLGAIVVALLLYLGLLGGLLQAFTTWFIGSLALLFGLRGVVQKIIPAQVERGRTDEDLDAYNQVVKVSERIPAGGEGRIHFRGTTWTARNYHGDRDLEPGTEVRIIFRENLAWMVEAVATPGGPEQRSETQSNKENPP